MKDRTSFAIASIINAAFETGLNPEWFEVDSLSRNGFLDAAFADADLSPTASGKPPVADWFINARLNADQVPSNKPADTKWNKVTAKVALRRLRRYVKNPKTTAHAKNRILKYLFYIMLLESDLPTDDCMDVRSSFDFDGVDDDCFAQIAIGKDVIYG